MTEPGSAVTGGIPVDREIFRNVVGHFASGVAVITTTVDGQPFGTTASAVSSLSMDPPMMLVCLNRSSSTHDAIVKAGHYAINILAIEQDGVAATFARKGVDKFASIAYETGVSGAPVLRDALASIECVVSDTAVGGTHTIFLGEAVHAAARPGEPLAYFRGRFDALAKSAEAAAYDGVRSWILQRNVAPGTPIQVPDLAVSVDANPSAVYNALVRLVAEGLVRRSDDGDFTPAAITEALVDNLYRARQTIESGVIERYLSDASDEQLTDIVSRAAELTAREVNDSDGLDSFLVENLDFHSAIVALAGSRQLVNQFRQLSIASVWRETYRSKVWNSRSGHPLIASLANALADRDVDRARELVEEQIELVRQAAKSFIADRGGIV